MKLYQHQQEALNHTKGKNRVAYFHDMGLGKTFTGAEKMMQIGNRVNLVICQKSKILDWCEHLYTHYHKRYLIFERGILTESFRDGIS